MADDYIHLIRELNLPKPIVIGFSDGGEIALYLGSKYFNEIGAIITTGVIAELNEQGKSYLAGWGIYGPRDIDFELLHTVLGEYLNTMKKEFRYVYGEDYWKKYFELVSEMWLDDQGYLDDEQVRNIKVNTMIMQGDRDDACSVERAIELYRFIPNAELAIAPNSGHGYPIGNAKLFYHLIKNFL